MTNVRRVGRSDVDNESEITNGIFSFDIVEGSINKSNDEFDNEGNGTSLPSIDTIGIIGGDELTCVVVSITYWII